MAIYFKKESTDNIVVNLLQKQDVPAHEKIGALYKNTVLLLNQQNADSNQVANLLKELSVFPSDKSAMQALAPLLKILEDGSLKITTSQNTGIYFIQKENKNVAVFKIGRKRAAMETTARYLAHCLGLEKHMIPGMFCALMNPPLFPETIPCEESSESEDYYNFTQSSEEQSSESIEKKTVVTSSSSDQNETVEELWNGLIKIYTQLLSDKKATHAVVGIVQPFLEDHPEAASVYDFTLMTIHALAIGLRDGKKDGYKGSEWFDVEDAFPIRIDPVWTPEKILQSASAIDLPYLDEDERTTTPLTLEEVNKLAKIVQQWRISAIIDNLRHLKIRYEDKKTEDMVEEDMGVDEGGCKICVYEEEKEHLINGRLNHLTPENEKRRIFLPSQLDACNARLQRIYDFVIACAMQQRTFTPQEVVHAVDKWGKIYQEAIQSSPKLSRSVAFTMQNQGPFHVIGRQPPNSCGLSISQELINNEKK